MSFGISEYWSEGDFNLKNTPAAWRTNKIISDIFSVSRVIFLLSVFQCIVLLYYGHIYIFCLMTFLILCLFSWNLVNTKKKRNLLVDYIENLSFYADSVKRESLADFPIPVLLVDSEGISLWSNRAFREISDFSQSGRASVSDMFPEIKLDDVLSSGLNRKYFLKTDSKCYDVFVQRVPGSESIPDSGAVICLVDRTSEHLLSLKYEGSKTVVCILIIDNFEEVMLNVSDSVQTVIKNAIVQRISNWAESIGALSIKYEKDRYYVIFPKKSLETQVAKKFDILGEFRSINEGNKIHVTVSMGIGLHDDILESYREAKAAVDMALGRGGDQVVIKNKDKFQFFGGISQEIEKRTKVRSRVVAHVIKELIINKRVVLIMGHRFSDADVIGSAVALWKVIHSLQSAECYVVINKEECVGKPILELFSNNEFYERTFISAEEAMEFSSDETLLIVVDTHVNSYIESPSLLRKIEQKVVIDHHRKTADAIENAVLMYHEPYASSTSEMVVEIVQYMEDKTSLTPLEAQALYAGILIDTKNFSFKTGVRTFESASFLKRIGVDSLKVKKILQTDYDTVMKKAELIRSAEIFRGSFAIAKTEFDCENPTTLASQTSDDLLNVKDVTAAFTLCGKNGVIYISARSMGDVNVQVILEKLGGGGHITMAGAQLEGVGLDDADAKLKESILSAIGSE